MTVQVSGLLGPSLDFFDFVACYKRYVEPSFGNIDGWTGTSELQIGEGWFNMYVVASCKNTHTNLETYKVGKFFLVFVMYGV